MRRYLSRALARDPRVQLVHGDPLPHYHRANVYVHPSYQDGFGLAPLEAAACGLPLIVTADTGMQELLVLGEGGFVVPTGEVGPLVDLLRLLGTNPILRSRLGAGARAAAERWVRGGGNGLCASGITHTA
jgi:glycosyltransferase involved in cell wall biosynthesis